MYAYNTAAANTIAAIRQARREAAPLHAARIAALIERNRIAAVERNIASFFVAVAQIASEQAEKPAPAKPAFIGRKALIAACQSMDIATVLFAGNRRQTSVSGGYVGYAAEKALAHFMSATFGQMNHSTKRGMSANPTWFRQLYTDLAWASGDITPGSILQALA